MTEFIAPGSDEWRTTISASKVAGLLGLSPWATARKLYHTMRGDIPPDPGNDATRRGHYLEPAVLAWFRDRHPDMVHGDTFTARHPDHPEWTCTPDATADDDLVEIKSAADAYEWGRQGTAEIPAGYLAQTAWQMIVTGARRVWVPIITGRLEFREYVVEWDDIAGDVPVILDRVREFQHHLATGTPPAWVGADTEYHVVKALHPDLVDEAVTVPAAVAFEYAAALIAEDDAKARAVRAKAAVIEHSRGARKILAPDGTQIAYRSGGKGNAPSLTKTNGIHQLTRKAA